MNVRNVAGTHPFPVLRWAALVWMAIWLPAYVMVWGSANLLHLCDAAVILACIGVWCKSPLLLSSQVLSSLMAGVLWTLDVCGRLAGGVLYVWPGGVPHLVGGTEYMWDARYPLWVRLMSLFHIGLPVLLLWTLRKVGYDRRALAAQSVLAAGLLVVSRFFSVELNLNYAYRDPLLHRAWGPTPVHLAVILVGMVALLYWPTHLLLGRIYRKAGRVD